jgi:tetratricopeptide (TPR) repeat protein
MSNTTAEERKAADGWKSVGNRHMASKEYEDAYEAYCTAIQISPLGPSSHIYLSNRAAALLSLKRYSAASVDARRAITLAPTFGKAHARLGQSLYFIKDYAGAVAAYENAFQFEPENQVTWTYLNKAKKKFVREDEKRRMKDDEEIDQQNQKERAQDYGRVRWDDGHDSTSASKGNDHAYESVYDDGLSVTDTVDLANMALSFVDSAKDLSTSIIGPNGPENEEDDDRSNEDEYITSTRSSGNAMNSVHAALNNDRSRLDRLDETDEIDDDDEDPDFDEALRLQEGAAIKLLNKKYREAVEEFSAALFLVPDDDNLTPQLYVGRANSLNGLERHEGALNDAMMALGRDPEMGEAHLVLARTYFYLKDYCEAEQSFENALECLGEISPLDQMYLKKSNELSDIASLDFDDSRSPSFSVSRQSASKPVPKLKPPRFVSRKQQLSSTQNVPRMPKKWAKQLHGPELSEALKVGPERIVTFSSKAMGVKLNRGPDGIIRVLSIAQRGDVSRQGDMYSGDILREAAGVDLRRPLTHVMWSDTVALLKIAPRPMMIKVAMELSKKLPAVQKEFNEAQRSTQSENRTPQSRRRQHQRHEMMSPPSC